MASSPGSVPNPAAITAPHLKNIRLVLLLLAGMLVLWTLASALSHTAPDLDSMEELVWASSFELGYTKHPPFPTWVLYLMAWVLGKPIWLPFFAGMLSSVIALWFVWRLGCEFSSPDRALIATLLVSTSTYFAVRASIFNHDTAQLWSMAACIWLFYRALRHEKTGSWLALGAVAGLSFLTKYSAVIQFAAFFLFMLVQGHLLQASVWKGLLRAGVVFLLVISPHIYWLFVNDFAPFHYLDGSMQESSRWSALYGVVNFALGQMARISPVFIMTGILVYWDKRKRNRSLQTYAGQLTPWDRSFLLWTGLAPFILTLLVSAVLGTRLSASWGTTFFILYGFFAFWWLSGESRLTLCRALIVVITAHIIMALGYAIARGPLVHQSGRASRSSYPGPEISMLMQEAWKQHVPDIPLQLVASDTWMGGNIAIHAGPDTQVFVDGGWAESPWLNPATALQCGVLVAYDISKSRQPDARLLALREQAVWQGQSRLHWSSPKSPLIVIDWGIIPPQEACFLKPAS